MAKYETAFKLKAQGSEVGVTRLAVQASGVTQTSAFVAVQLPSAQPAPDIRIELCRSATAITVHWPIAEAAQCAVLIRELLR